MSLFYDESLCLYFVECQRCSVHNFVISSDQEGCTLGMRFENPIWASFLVSLKMPNFGDLKTRYGAKDFRCDIKSRSERCGAKSIAPLKSPLCTSLWFGNTKNVITFLGNTQYQIYSAPEGITEDKRLLWTTRIECEGSGDFRLYTHTELDDFI